MSGFLHQLGQRALGASSRVRPRATAELAGLIKPPPDAAADALAAAVTPESQTSPSRRPMRLSPMDKRSADPAASPDWDDRPLEKTPRTASNAVRDRDGDDVADGPEMPSGQGSVGHSSETAADPPPLSADARALISAAPTDRDPRPMAKHPDRRVADGIEAVVARPNEKERRPAHRTQEPAATVEARPLRQAEWRRDEAAAPEVNIHIGRIELTALMAPALAPARREAVAAKTSLDDYLRPRSGRRS
jgi:hypothetical protein